MDLRFIRSVIFSNGELEKWKIPRWICSMFIIVVMTYSVDSMERCILVKALRCLSHLVRRKMPRTRLKSCVFNFPHCAARLKRRSFSLTPVPHNSHSSSSTIVQYTTWYLLRKHTDSFCDNKDNFSSPVRVLLDPVVRPLCVINSITYCILSCSLFLYVDLPIF